MALWLAALAAAWPGAPGAQEQGTAPKASELLAPREPAQAAPRPEAEREVGVQGVARDEQIAQRLQSILAATGWFVEPAVTVRNGVVFLDGRARSPENKVWAGNLAQRTEDVAAVVNRIELIERPVWDVSPSVAELRDFWRQLARVLPLLGFGLLILLAALLVALGLGRLAGRLLGLRLANALLVDVTRKVVFIVVLLAGLFLMLRVSGLSRLALTLAGGTGIAGLVIGIALRDIAENFLASLLISIQHPFRTGDLIELEDHLGYVRKVTTRGTVLLTFEGTYVQIPNAKVYKATIRNYTANPNQRLDFRIGIGYDTPISRAQETGLRVLRGHPAVLDSPEPMVLVEEFGAATINLRVYFWVNNLEHSVLRVKSAAMRLMVRAFQEAGISLPDEAREVIFPQGVPVRMLGEEAAERPEAPRPQRPPVDTGAVSTEAEGALGTEARDLEHQARQSRQPESGRNLLEEGGGGESPKGR